MSAMERNEMHAALCAYLLGELPADERARVEAALAESAELREEKERLGATIGLVQGSFEGQASLSDGALANILAAAGAETGATRGPRAIPSPRIGGSWVFGPSLRAAAAVLFVTGGVLGILKLQGGSALQVAEAPADEHVAQAEPMLGKSKHERFERGAKRQDAPAERAIGGDANQVGLSATLESEAPALDDLRAGRRLEAVAEADSVQATIGLEELAARDGEAPELRLDSTRAPAREQQTSADERISQWADESVLVAQSDPAVEGGPPSTGFIFEDGGSGDSRARLELELKDLGVSMGGQPTLPGESEVTLGRAVVTPALETATGSDVYLGGGEERKVADAESAKGNDRAPGNTVPSSGGGGAPSAGGPTTPGPASPGSALGISDPKRRAREVPQSPAPVTGTPLAQRKKRKEAQEAPEAADYAVETWLADAPDADDQAAIEKLRGLGYLGDTDADISLEALGHVSGERQRRLSPEELRALIQRETERCLSACRRRPSERPRAMYFRFWGDNAFGLTELDRLSTFAVDVDTASYALARRYLKEGHLPEKAQIRTEEFLNYFDPDLAAPIEETFAIHTELAPSLFGGREDRWLLRVGVRGREVSKAERNPLALTFVVDTSGSMKENQRLELVKHAMRLLVSELDARDSIAIVAYSNEARVILPMTSAAQKGVIEAALHPLQPNGSTNAEGGLKLGYEIALAALTQGTNHRVVFLSDGVANVGQTDQNRINADIARHREQGIYLNTIGVGMNNHNDVFLEQLANKGDGICDYIDDAKAAQRAIVERFSGAFEPIASDVKIQVEFDPAQVQRYRLLGYENRAIADKDFRNDAIDAGEIGAGHQVVALYELERTSAASEGPLATVRLRWKAPKVALQDPNEIDVTEIESVVQGANAVGSFAAASPGFRRSTLVAQFAEFMRRSTHVAGDSYSSLTQQSAKLAAETQDPDFVEFVQLVRLAERLILAETNRVTSFERVLDEFRRLQYLKAELESVKRDSNAELLEELRRQNEGLERQIRDLIRADVEKRHG